MKTEKPKSVIRVVKRDERTRRDSKLTQSQSIEQEAPKKTTQETARDMVATVTGWVSELEHRHRTETARALKILFPETNPQVN